jgi:hypothetical protein
LGPTAELVRTGRLFWPSGPCRNQPPSVRAAPPEQTRPLSARSRVRMKGRPLRPSSRLGGACSGPDVRFSRPHPEVTICSAASLQCATRRHRPRRRPAGLRPSSTCHEPRCTTDMIERDLDVPAGVDAVRAVRAVGVGERGHVPDPGEIGDHRVAGEVAHRAEAQADVVPQRSGRHAGEPAAAIGRCGSGIRRPGPRCTP